MEDVEVSADGNILIPKIDCVSEISYEAVSLEQNNENVRGKRNRAFTLSSVILHAKGSKREYVILGFGLATIISVTIVVAVLSSTGALQKETKDDIQSFNSILSANNFVEESMAPSESVGYIRSLLPTTLDLDLSDGELCLENSNCWNKICAREFGTLESNLICCPSSTQINSEYYCTEMTAGTRCVSNDMCASQHCDPVNQECALKKVAEPCRSNIECIHGTCAMAYMWTTNNLCCPTSDDNIVDDTDGKLYCAGMEIDAPCLNTEMCNGDNICLDGFCRVRTSQPVHSPTLLPVPTVLPISGPTYAPTYNPTKDPSGEPTYYPTRDPTMSPTGDPTMSPTDGYCGDYFSACSEDNDCCDLACINLLLVKFCF